MSFEELMANSEGISLEKVRETIAINPSFYAEERIIWDAGKQEGVREGLERVAVIAVTRFLASTLNGEAGQDIAEAIRKEIK